MEIILIRHTTPDIAKGICYGQSDIDITEDFDNEAAVITSQSIIKNFDAIYTSPLKRCKKLAEKIGSNYSLDDRLMELDFGEWELKSWNTIPKEEITPWMDNFVSIPTKNGESYINLYDRVVQFFNEIIQKEYTKVVIVTHAGVMRALWSYWNTIPLDKSFDLKLNYGAILKIDTLSKNN